MSETSSSVALPSPLVLASNSPRRRQLLSEHGVEHIAMAPHIDDGQLPAPVLAPDQWVCALAHLKARSALGAAREAHPACIVLGADTVVVKENRIIGQPRDRADAERILRLLSDGSHRVLSGVALLLPERETRVLFCDSAQVFVGALEASQIEPYLDSDQWRGKAGAYNLYERIDAGWPIRYEGDPTTIMGLPMRRLLPALQRIEHETT